MGQMTKRERLVTVGNFIAASLNMPDYILSLSRVS